MEALLIGIYSFFVWLIFFKFKWLPWNTISKAIVVTIRQGGGFPDGGSLTWTSSVDAAGKAGWTCTGRRIAETILPAECR